MNSMSFLSSALKSKSASGAGKAIKDAIAAGKPSKGSGLATTAVRRNGASPSDNKLKNSYGPPSIKGLRLDLFENRSALARAGYDMNPLLRTIKNACVFEAGGKFNINILKTGVNAFGSFYEIFCLVNAPQIWGVRYDNRASPEGKTYPKYYQAIHFGAGKPSVRTSNAVRPVKV